MGMAYVAPEGEADGDDFEVWEENWESVIWFLRMSRRWVFSPMDGSRIRLDDQAVMLQLKLQVSKKSKRQKIMDDLLAMEDAALEVLTRE